MPGSIHEPCGQPVAYIGNRKYVHIETWTDECPLDKTVAAEEKDT